VIWSFAQQHKPLRAPFSIPISQVQFVELVEESSLTFSFSRGRAGATLLGSKFLQKPEDACLFGIEGGGHSVSEVEIFKKAGWDQMHLLGHAPEGWLATPRPRLRVACTPTIRMGMLWFDLANWLRRFRNGKKPIEWQELR
jgi:hypothetical protein